MVLNCCPQVLCGGYKYQLQKNLIRIEYVLLLLTEGLFVRKFATDYVKYCYLLASLRLLFFYPNILNGLEHVDFKPS